MNTLDSNEMQERILINSELAQYKTNHVLHLILTILTVGFWSLCWIFASSSTIQKQNDVRKKYKIKQKFNAPAVTIIVWVAVIVVAAATIN